MRFFQLLFLGDIKAAAIQQVLIYAQAPIQHVVLKNDADFSLDLFALAVEIHAANAYTSAALEQ